VTKRIQYKDGSVVVEIAVDDDVPRASSASSKAGVADTFADTVERAKGTLKDSVAVVGQIASAFSESLQLAEPKPTEVEISFGMEASGEAGNFLISKLGAKTNFAVKMTWKK